MRRGCDAAVVSATRRDGDRADKSVTTGKAGSLGAEPPANRGLGGSGRDWGGVSDRIRFFFDDPAARPLVDPPLDRGAAVVLLVDRARQLDDVKEDVKDMQCKCMPPLAGWGTIKVRHPISIGAWNRHRSEEQGNAAGAGLTRLAGIVSGQAVSRRIGRDAAQPGQTFVAAGRRRAPDSPLVSGDSVGRIVLRQRGAAHASRSAGCCPCPSFLCSSGKIFAQEAPGSGSSCPH
jgi:hypothetical protein